MYQYHGLALTLGMAIGIVVALWAFKELSYENNNKDRRNRLVKWLILGVCMFVIGVIGLGMLWAKDGNISPTSSRRGYGPTIIYQRPGGIPGMSSICIKSNGHVGITVMPGVCM